MDSTNAVRIRTVGDLAQSDIGARIDVNERSFDNAELRMIIPGQATTTIVVADTDSNDQRTRRHTLANDDVVALWTAPNEALADTPIAIPEGMSACRRQI